MKSYEIYEVPNGVVVYVYDEDGEFLYATPERDYIGFDELVDMAQHGYNSDIRCMEAPLHTYIADISMNGAITLYPREMSAKYKDIFDIPDDLRDEETLDFPTLYAILRKDAVWEYARQEILRNKLGLTRVEAACYNIDVIAVMMADGCSKSRALKMYDKGSTVFNITREPWDEVYAEEWEVSLAEIKAGQIDGMSYLEYNDTEYVIAYVL